MSESIDVVHGTQILRGMADLRRRFGPASRAFRLLALAHQDTPLSIASLLEETAEQYPDRPAVLFESCSLTYAEFNAAANRCAHALASRGIRQGDVVAVMLENSAELLVCVAAIVKLGAVAAMINTAQRGEVLAHSLKLCNAKARISGPETHAAFSGLPPAGCEQAGPDFYLSPADDTVPDGTLNLKVLAATQPDRNPETVKPILMRDPAFYIFTSGTTGLPKASVMSHFRWVKAFAGGGILALNMQTEDVLYCALPFYHNNALTLCWSAAMAGGSALAISRKFSASCFWQEIHDTRATVFCYIGEFCRYLMAQPPSQLDRGHQVTRIFGNGLRPDLWKPFKQRFGIERVLEFYGASESNIGFINLFNLDNTVGFCPMPYAIVEYDPDSGQPLRNRRGHLIRVKKGEAGLLLGKVNRQTPYDGYTDPAASEAKLVRDAFRRGDCWFNTGDLLREMGWKHAQFVDRLGDTFRWKGENVSTTEVEQVLNEFADVQQAVVYGVEIPGCDGRAGMACIVAPYDDPDQFDFRGLLAHLEQGLPAYALPLFLRFTREHATTATFKPKKADLKAEGYGAANPDEAVFWYDSTNRTYSRLDDAIRKRIQSGDLRF